MNRQLAWTEQGFEWHADTKHSRSVLLKHGLVEEKSTSAVSPGCKASGTNIRDGENHLGVQEAKAYAGIAGTLLYHALDQLDLQFTVGQLMSAITRPQRKHLATMKHCLRFLVGRRCCAWKFDYQEWPGELVILTDADWASDTERRRSVDSVHISHGGHLIEASTSTQQVVSLTTAESEFYGIVRGTASGIQLREAFMQFGFSVRLRVLSDSSAAQATTARTGSGRVKHVEARYLSARPRQKETVLGGEHRHLPQHGRLGHEVPQRRALAGADADDAHRGRRVRANEAPEEVARGVVLGVPGDAGAG